MDSSRSRPARRWTRLAWTLVPAAVFLALLGFALDAAGGPLGPGDEAPGFSGPRLGGGSLALDDLDGKPVVLNFWASWCLPCEDEAPMLRRADSALGDEVAFVGINIRDSEEDALAFVRRYRLDYPHVRDEDQSIYEAYGLTGQPETFFIDAQGVVVEHVNGPLFEEDLSRLLESLASSDG
jgi:cytochrome c biogenesis protein CcmG, thiol:disulfide interchange protein DsbE